MKLGTLECTWDVVEYVLIHLLCSVMVFFFHFKSPSPVSSNSQTQPLVAAGRLKTRNSETLRKDIKSVHPGKRSHNETQRPSVRLQSTNTRLRFKWRKRCGKEIT